LSRIFDALRRAELARAPHPGGPVGDDLQVVTVTSNKGGVGKTTLATNLAVYLRALDEELPILVFSLDDQLAIDRMFAFDARAKAPDVADGLRQGTLAPAIRLGQYGVHYVPSSRRVAELKRTLAGDGELRAVLRRTGWRGLVVIDTKSDLEVLTRNAIAAADLSLVVVKDQLSVLEAERVFALLDAWGVAREHARIVLSLVDLRVRYREGDSRDVLGLLVAEVQRRGLPLFESFVSRSPKVESLYTNPHGQALSILHAAAATPVHGQMRRLAEEVRRTLASLRAGGAAPGRMEIGAASETGIDRMKRWLLQRGRPEP
jgi:cellulose biosynthesis protein BcsQ